MALDNYLEMRERVADPKFQLQQALALELERRFPHRFIPRYSMVMFHHEIPYRTAAQRGSIQAQLLADLTTGVSALVDIDYLRAEREIESPARADSGFIQRDEAIGAAVRFVRLVTFTERFTPFRAPPLVKERIAVRRSAHAPT